VDAAHLAGRVWEAAADSGTRGERAASLIVLERLFCKNEIFSSRKLGLAPLKVAL
jgi:hypothetical protein